MAKHTVNKRFQKRRIGKTSRLQITVGNKTPMLGKLPKKNVHGHRRLLLESDESNEPLRKFCYKTIQGGIQALTQQFQELKKQTSICPAKVASDSNVSKNRYKDVPCIDKTRVSLKWPSGNHDYIHANYVDFMGEKKFICTQAPIESTVDDFWRLIWQEKCKAIIMLCEIIEQNRKKCEAYWPSEIGKTFISQPSGLLIRNVDVMPLETTITLSRLEVCFGDEKLFIKHFKWNNWPDRGVPELKLAPLRLLAHVSTIEPVAIHCSAGIGRTGTIVGLYMAMQVLQAGEDLSLLKVISALRESRYGSVQNDTQYVYMHRTLIAVADNKKLLQSSDVEKFDQEYEAFLKIRENKNPL